MKKYVLKKNYNNNIHYYFINLDRSIDRLDAFKNNFSYLFENNLITRFIGVDISKKKKDTKDHILNIDIGENSFIINTKKYKDLKLKDGEIGCALSHINCILLGLKRFKNEYAVIFEDDIKPYVDDYQKRIINIISNAPRDWTIIQLITTNPKIHNLLKEKKKSYISTKTNSEFYFNNCWCAAV